MEIFCPLYRNGGLRGHHANAHGNLSTAGELNNTLSDVLRARLEHNINRAVSKVILHLDRL